MGSEKENKKILIYLEYKDTEGIKSGIFELLNIDDTFYTIKSAKNVLQINKNSIIKVKQSHSTYRDGGLSIENFDKTNLKRLSRR